MKKLMLMAVAAVLAVGAQAATVNWKSGANVLGPDGSTKLGKDAYMMYVWDNLSESQYNSLSVDKVYDTYSTQLASAKSASSGSATLGTTVKNTSAADDTTYYAAVLLIYKEGSDTYYIANKAMGTTDAVGGGVTVTGLGKFIGGGTSGTAVTWTAAPEPTSGLLMLLGLAGLALKRKVS